IRGDEVGHFPIFGMASALLDDIEFRRIGGQEFHMAARAIDMFEQACRFLVPAEAIPDHEQRALEGPVQLLDKGKGLVARDIRRGYGEIEAQAFVDWGDGDGTGHGEAVVTDIYGVSARAMLEAILAGQRDVEALADLARGRLRPKRDQFKE